MEPLSAFLTLLFVMDPLGNVPMFLAALAEVPEKRRIKVIVRELLIALAVLLFFLFAGHHLLDMLGIEQSSIRITGAIILFIIAMRMIFPSHQTEQTDGEPLIVPLAVPYVAGPSTLAILMIMVKSDAGAMWQFTLALLGAWGITSIILVLCAPISRILGGKGTRAIERLMGMALVMLAVQMFISALRDLAGSF